MMAQLAAVTVSSKKTKKKKNYTVEIWNKEPTGEELREIAEITECFEENGIEVDPDTIRRAVVNDNQPKYMSLIEKDLLDDRNLQKELDFASLQQRRDTSNLFESNAGRSKPQQNSPLLRGSMMKGDSRVGTAGAKQINSEGGKS